MGGRINFSRWLHDFQSVGSQQSGAGRSGAAERRPSRRAASAEPLFSLLLACSRRSGAGSGDPGASGVGEDPPAASRRERGPRRSPASSGAAAAAGGGGRGRAASPARRRHRVLRAPPPRSALPRPGLRGGASARGGAAAPGGAALLLHGTRAEPQRLLRLPQHLRRAGTAAPPPL